MPLVRFTVRNEFGLGQPELYGDCTGEDGDSKGVLSGVVVAGLVGILRQLGDLAEFAAEVFHGIQEQVTVTASRSRKLTSRVRRIESALPPLEKTVLSQTSHIHFSYTAGYEWHPFMQNERNHFINNDLPLFVMESYEQCRDPPRLHLLDKFDIGGPGSCLRRYSDPTFFKKESGDLVEANDVKVQRDKSYFKRKKKRLSQRNRAISRAASISKETSRMHLSSPTDDGQTTSQTTSSVGLGCTSNMLEQSEEHEQLYVREQSDVQAQPQTRGQFNCLEPSNTHDSRNGSGYIEYLINQGPVSKPEEKLLGEFQSRPNQQADSKCSILATGCTEVVDDNILCSPSREQPVTCVSPDSRYKKDEAFHSEYEQRIEEEEALEILESNIGPETPERITQSQRSSDRMDIQFDEVDDAGQIPCWAQLSRTIRRPDSEGQEKNQSEWGSEIETESEGDVFVDAQNTIDSESDNDLDGQPKHKLDHYSKNVTGNSLEDECPSNDNNLGSVDTPHNHTVESPGHDHLSDESSAMSYISEKGKTTCVLADPVREEAASDDKTSQVPSPSLVEAVPYQEILPEVPVATSPSSGEAVPEEKFSPEEPVATYPTLGEAVLEEKFLPEEPVATYPLLARAFLGENGKASCVLPDPVRKEAVSDDKAFQEPGEPDSSCCPSIIEAVQPQEFLPEESVATSPSLEEVIPEEEISPEKPVSLEAFSDDKTSQEPRESSVGTSCPLLGEALPDTKILPEGLVAAYLLSGKAIPDEKISPPESLDTYPLLAEAVPDENREASRVLLDSVTEEALDKIILPEEPLTACTLLGEAVPDKNILPEDPIVAYLSLDEAVLDEMVSTEEPVAAYPSLADGVLDENREVSCVMPDPVSEEAVSDGKTFQEPVESVVACCQSLGKTLPDEKNLLEEPVAVYPWLGEAIPAEKDLQEEPFVAYPSLGAAVADEKVMPEESVVAYPMLGDAVLNENGKVSCGMPEPRLEEAVSDGKTFQEPVESVVACCQSLGKTLPDEKNLLEEPVAVYPSLGEAVPAEKDLQEEPFVAYPSLGAVVADEKVMPEESVVAYPMLGDAVLNENGKVSCVMPEPRLEEAVSDGKTFQEPVESVVACCQSLGKTLPDEKNLLEEPVSVYPSLGEAVPAEKDLQEEPFVAYPSLGAAVADEKVMPEESVVAYPMLGDAALNENGKVSCVMPEPRLEEAVSDGRTFQEPVESVVACCQSLGKTLPDEKNSLEEPVAVYPSLGEAVPAEKDLQEEPFVAYPSLGAAVADEKVMPEESVVAYPMLGDAVLNENGKVSCVMSEPRLEEAVSDGKTFQEPVESVVACCQSLGKTLPDEKNLLEEPVAVYPSLGEAVPAEKDLQEEPFVAYPSLGAAVADEKVPEESVVAYPMLGDAVLNENGKVSCVMPEPRLEEAVSDGKTFQEPVESVVACCQSLGKTLPVEKNLLEEPVAVYPSLGEAVPAEKDLQEEPFVAYPSLGAAVADEKVMPEESVVAYPMLGDAVLNENGKVSCVMPEPRLEEAVSDGRTFQEPVESVVACCQSLGKTLPDEKNLLEEPVAVYPSLGEAVPAEKDLQEEPFVAYPSLGAAVADEKVMPEESVVAYPMLGDAVLNENGKVSCVMPEPRLEEAVSDGKTFQEPVESVVACCQSLGEALSNEKILPEEHVAYSLLGEANLNKNGEISCVMPDSVPEAATSDGTFQEPGESVVMCCQSLGEALPDDKILPEEPVATYQPLKGVPDEKVSPEEPVVAHPLREAMLDGNGEVSYVLPDPVPEEAVYDSMTSQESRESVSTCCSLLQKTLPDEKILSEPVVAHSLSGEAVPDGKILPEPVVAYPSSEEAIPEEKISSVKHVVVVPRSAAVPYKKILSEEPVAVCFPDGDHAVDEPHRASDASENERTICVFPEPISTQTIPAEAESHIRGYDLAVSDPYAGTEVDKNLNRESLTTCSPTVSVHSMLDTRSPLNHAYVNRQSDPQESLANNPYVESIKIWSNGSLLGLEPSKPPVFAAPSSVRGDIESKNNGGTNVLATEKTELSEKSVEGTDSFRSVPCTNNEKASPPLAASEPDSQHSSQLAHHNGSHPQNTALSFGVFGLSHRLLMNGFRRNSSGSSIESLPVSKNTEAAVEGRLGLLHQQTHDSTFFIEPFGCQSLLRAPPSPPLEHMKISFNRIDGFAGSKLKLKIPHQPQYSLRNSDMFSSFQLVPEFASPRNHDSDSDDENDTFCGSSPCISDNHSASDSELWESDESPVGKDKDLVNTFRSVSSGDSTSSFFSQVVDRSAHDEISMDPFLDFPCFDAVDPSLVRDRKLKSPTEPLSPALRGSFEHKQALAPKSPGETAESVPLSKKPDREKSPNLDNNRQDVNMEDFSLLI